MGGLTDKAKGQIKGGGAAVDDDELQSEGKLDQAKGHLKDAAENEERLGWRGPAKKRAGELKKEAAGGGAWRRPRTSRTDH
jgi:uncharacterized protein YjbJ (UPF0337 family)